jgi:hypothetical protein
MRRRPRVLISDPCTIGRRHFPRVRTFVTWREAEKYARDANRYQLGAVVELSYGRRG